MNKKEEFLIELEKRINEIEQYSTDSHFSKKDYIIVILFVMICLVMIIIGAYV